MDCRFYCEMNLFGFQDVMRLLREGKLMEKQYLFALCYIELTKRDLVGTFSTKIFCNFNKLDVEHDIEHFHFHSTQLKLKSNRNLF